MTERGTGEGQTWPSDLDLTEDQRSGRHAIVGERPAFVDVRIADTVVDREPGERAGGPDDENLDRLVPLEVIATGGMGVVRRYHDMVLGRDVAAKEMRADQRDSERVRHRFLQEARIQANLQHPCIVPLYDIGRPATEDMFFTMAHVEGTTLREVLGRRRAGDEATARRFSRRALLEAFCRVCLAVEYAHEQGVVHRDLKPENIMLGDYGEVWVLDWGVAKLSGTTGRCSSGISRARSWRATPAERIPTLDSEPPDIVTNVGERLGTLEYLAPEQYIGARDSDRRSDVYSLGAILYEVLSLRWFRHASDPNELARVVWRDTFAPEPRAAIESESEEMNALWQRATAAKPESRYASAQQLHEALSALLDAEREPGRAEESATASARRAATERERAASRRQSMQSASVLAAALALMLVYEGWPGREWHPAMWLVGAATLGQLLACAVGTVLRERARKRE
ncbi:MAG: serine/threonine-protein kinase [Polyangiaceae bacterium]